MDRRDFVRTSFLAVASTMLGASCTVPVTPSRNSYQQGRGYAFVGLAVDHTKSILRTLNLDTYDYQDIVIPISSPNAVARVGNDLFVMDFQGSAVKVDMKSGDMMKAPDGFFLGHSYYAENDGILWCTERTGLGLDFVRPRSVSTLKVIDDKLSFPGGHHVTRMPGTDLIVSCGSHQGKHFVSFFDFQKKIMKKQVSCQYPGVHALPISPNEIVASTTEHVMAESQLISFSRMDDPRTRDSMSDEEKHFAGHSPVMYANLNSEVKDLWDPSRKELFQLGLGIDRVGDKTQRFLTSHYSAQTVILWNGLQIEKVYQVPYPLVIVATSDAKSFVVQSERRLRVYSLETGELEKELNYPFPVYTLSRY